MPKHLLHIYQINFLAVFALLVSCSIKAETNDVLWFDSPANNWEEALPLGNGKLGVMVSGQTGSEHIQLNDDSMWPGKAGWDEPEGNAGDIEKMGRAMLAYPDWFVKNQPRPSQGRKTFSIWYYYRKDSPLKPAGLVGPVRLVTESEVE